MMTPDLAGPKDQTDHVPQAPHIFDSFQRSIVIGGGVRARLGAFDFATWSILFMDHILYK